MPLFPNALIHLLQTQGRVEIYLEARSPEKCLYPFAKASFCSDAQKLSGKYSHDQTRELERNYPEGW